MKKTQKIQLGSMTVLVVALMQAGVVYAGAPIGPGVYIDTSAIPNFSGCSNANPNPTSSSGCTVTVVSGTQTIGLNAPYVFGSTNYSGISVQGNVSAIDTINFTGIAYGGGNGQAGVALNSSGTVAFNLVSGSINGGAGVGVSGTTGTDGSGAYGSGANGGIGGVGGNVDPANNVGGIGGSGVSGEKFSMNNQAQIAGGTGGMSVGGQGGNAKGGAAPGGNGVGGAGGLGGAGGVGGVGGVGGAGISGRDFSVTNTSTGSITGGAGGSGDGGRGGDSSGGDGGYSGGNYGPGGIAGTGGAGGTGGVGGVGGVGVTGSSFTLINHGTIAGGNGGTATGGSGGFSKGGVGNPMGNSGTVGAKGSDGIAGAGGIGVVSTGNATIINSGTISGGLNPISGIRADAINLSGAGNTLDLQAGSTINGNIISNAVTTVSGSAQINGNFSNSGRVDIKDSGYANISGNFLNSGSVSIAAGNQLYVGSDFTNTGTLTIVVTNTAYGNAAFGTLYVDGTATLSGSKLFVDARTLTKDHGYIQTTVNGVTTATLYGVIHADTGIVGTFASYSDNSALFDFTPVYTGADMNLTFAAASKSGVLDAVTTAGNTAGQGAASALDQIIVSNPTSAISLIFAGVGTGQVSNAVSQTLPQIAGVVSQSVTTNLGSITRIVQSRQDGQQGRSSGDNFYGDKKFWFKPFGSWANQDSQNGVAGYKSRSYGMIFGADADLSDVNRVGVAFAYSKTDIDSKGVAVQNANVDSYTALVYGTHNLTASTELSAQAGLGLNNTSGGRTINIGATNSRASSSYDSWSANVGVGLAHTMALSEKTNFIPSIRVDYSRIRSDAYSETGAGALNLNVGKNTSDALVLGADGKVSHAISNKATLVANLGVGYDFINDRSSLTSSFAGAPTITFATQGIDPSPWLIRGGFGVVGKVTQTMEVTARYDFEARRNFDNQTASVKARWMF
jgi:autotransporter family porin